MSTTDMDSVSRPAGAAKSLVKGLALVDLVARGPTPVRLTDLVERSGLPRPTALRLLEALVDGGLLRWDETQGYALGPRLAVWGQQYLEGMDLRAQAADLMAAMADRAGETCFLGVRERDHVLYIAKADGPHAVRPAARVGTRNPLHSTAIGKVLLAMGAVEVAEEYLRGALPPRTPHTITEADRLRAELDLVRRCGYATDDVENEDGVRCVAAPVRDHTGEVVAALSVSVPAYRLSLDDLHRLAPQVADTAADLATRMGHDGGAPPRATKEEL